MPGSSLVQPSTIRTELLIGQDREWWAEMSTAIHNLKALMSKVKTEGVKKNVERIATCYFKLVRSWSDLHAEFRA